MMSCGVTEDRDRGQRQRRSPLFPKCQMKCARHAPSRLLPSLRYLQRSSTSPLNSRFTTKLLSSERVYTATSYICKSQKQLWTHSKLWCPKYVRVYQTPRAIMQCRCTSVCLSDVCRHQVCSLSKWPWPLTCEWATNGNGKERLSGSLLYLLTVEAARSFRGQFANLISVPLIIS